MSGDTRSGWVRASAALPEVKRASTSVFVAPTDPAGSGERPPRCPECDGAGFFVTAVPVGDPRFGQLIPCRCKLEERQRRQAAQLKQLSNLGAFQDQTFDTFDPDVPGVRKAFLRAVDFAQRPRGWLLLFGPCGVGKSHLAAAAASQALASGKRVLYTVVPDLLDHLRATFGPSSEVGYDERFELVRTVPLLILDDLGTESATAWAREKLYQILNQRYNEDLPTIITSNRSPDSLESRVLSRMYQRAFGGELLQISADDYRRRSARGVS